MNVRRSGSIASLDTLWQTFCQSRNRGVLNEGTFHGMISLERKRTERSRKPFLLVLLDMGNRLQSDKNGKALDKILSALSLSTRETDVTGWYENNSVVGVMFFDPMNYADQYYGVKKKEDRPEKKKESEVAP